MSKKSVPPGSVYPSVSRGSLSETHTSYINPPQAKGPKKGNMQTKIIIFGVVFFVLFTIAMAYAFGIGGYFTE